MDLEPRALFMMAVVIGVTGWVVKELLLTVSRVIRGDGSKRNNDEIEERLRKLETATSSLLVDVSTIREKQRFMAKLEAGAVVQQAQHQEPPTQQREMPYDSGISPMSVQSIPVMARGRGGGGSGPPR